jgi:hypothetical protein
MSYTSTIVFYALCMLKFGFIFRKMKEVIQNMDQVYLTPSSVEVHLLKPSSTKLDI